MPFSHLTVLDIATLGAAPQIAAFFGDFGAHVIKVEHPRGDSLRRLVDQRGAALQWKIVNRNKQCVTLDLTLLRGRQLLERLLERCDLLVCALSRARLAKWGFESQKLPERYPRLVVVNLTAYGVEGPWGDRPGSGTLAEAMSGLAALTGLPDGPPTLSPVGLGDYMGVLEGIIAALTGLYARDCGRAGEPGVGQLFDVAMFEPMLALLAQRLAVTARDGLEPARYGNRFLTMAPRNTYRTAEGEWVALTAGTNDLVRELFRLIGRPELIGDPRFCDNLSRLEHAEALDEVIGSWIGARSCDEVVEAFRQAGVSLVSVDGLNRVLRNPHFGARKSLIEVSDDEVGPITVPAPAPRGSRHVGKIRHLARRLGADNQSVYREWLGISEAELASLREDGVI